MNVRIAVRAAINKKFRENLTALLREAQEFDDTTGKTPEEFEDMIYVLEENTRCLTAAVTCLNFIKGSLQESLKQVEESDDDEDYDDEEYNDDDEDYDDDDDDYDDDDDDYEEEESTHYPKLVNGEYRFDA